MKLEGDWTLEQPEPGCFVWTTPEGLRYTVPPEPIHEPTAEPVVEDQPPPF
jgi:hypothetical protein